MFSCDKNKQQAHIACMEKLKAENHARRKRRQELILRDWNQHIRGTAFLSSLRSQLSHLKSVDGSVSHQKSTPKIHSWEKLPVANYFSEQRIAVYTCIMGAYDLLVNPPLKPDNIDYYVITDQSFPADSMWTPFDVSHIQKELSATVIEQNRWYKMHPHLLFPDYDYSIYLDGNITPVSDLTEFINRIGSSGIATHNHYIRSCAYEEAKAILQRDKDIPENIKSHVDFLQKQGFLEGYGLADCSVIARKHHDSFCISLMEQWWKAFLMHSRRDQLSFPYVLFQNGVKIADIATLGSNRIFNDALDIRPHMKECSCTI